VSFESFAAAMEVQEMAAVLIRNKHSSTKLLLILLSLIGFGLPIIVHAAEPKEKLDYEKLIKELVNKNTEPTEKDSHRRFIFAKEYDWNEVARIDKVLQTIIDNFDDAWPTLVKHVNDKEYSFSAHIDFEDAYDANYSVGQVCRTVLRENLTQFSLRLGLVEYKFLRRAEYLTDTKDNKNVFQEWFTEQIKKDRKFYELQTEHGEYVIEKSRKFYAKSDADTKKYVEEEIDRFKKELDQFESKKATVLIKRFELTDGRILLRHDSNTKKEQK
jgi:hypothetical protein